MIAAYVYKRILKKLNLTKKELEMLRDKLNKEHVCYGPFIKENKTCPNTTALSIKTKRTFKENKEVSKQLKDLRINKLELLLFYITFDIPTIIKPKLLEQYLKQFKKITEELIVELNNQQHKKII